MGTTVRATLCFGFSLPESGRPEWVEEFGDFVAKKLFGGIPPKLCYMESTKPEYEVWWKFKRECQAQCGVEIVYHCNNEYPLYILAVKESIQNARLGDVQGLGSSSIPTLPSWDDTIRDFCDKAELPYVKPQWLLVSYTG